MPDKSYSVVVPVYNSCQILRELVERLKITLEDISNNFEVILVNDGSKDNSWQVICELVDSYDFVKGIDMMRNYGQHNALLAGIRNAQFEYTITIDDDLQHPPEEIAKLVEKLNEGWDVVYGKEQKKQHDFWRNMASHITRLLLSNMMGMKIAGTVSAFRAFRTQLRDGFSDYNSPSVSIDVLLTWSTNNFSYVETVHQPRLHGKSNYSLLKLISHAMDLATGFSTLPLKISSIIGFVFSLFGFGILVYVLTVYFHHGSIPGFPFLASIISIFAGIQLFALGVIGEYLSGIHFRTMKRPSYTIRSISKKRNNNISSQDTPG